MQILVAALLLLSAGCTLSDVSLQQSTSPNGSTNSSQSSTAQPSVTSSSSQPKNITVNLDLKAKQPENEEVQINVPPPSQNEPPAADAEAEALAQGVEKITIVDQDFASVGPVTVADSQLPSVAPGDDQRGTYDAMNRAPAKDYRWAPLPNRKPMTDYQYYMGYRAAEQPVAYDYYYYNYYYLDENYADYGYYANQPAYQYPNIQDNYQNEVSNNEWNRDDNELPKPQPTSQVTDNTQDIQQFRNRFLQSLQNFVPDADDYDMPK